MAALPSNAELRKLSVLGQTNTEIATQYGVTRQAVDRRLRHIGLYRRPIVNQVKIIIAEAWDINNTRNKHSHHHKSPFKSLKLWMRVRLGDADLNEEYRHVAANFEIKLNRENVVLAYDRDTVKGFTWEPRQPSDGHLAIRWPEDKPCPSEAARAVLSLKS